MVPEYIVSQRGEEYDARASGRFRIRGSKMGAHMKRHLRAVVIIIAALMFSGIALAQNNPRYGTWKLNLAKSKFDPGPPPKSQIRTYEAVGKGQRCAVEGL